MLVLDGNNSLKRMKSACGQREVGDSHTFNNSNYFLSNAHVDSFENEVRRPVQVYTKEEPEDQAIAGDEGDIVEVDHPQLDSCASNWKAVATTERKKMWGVFDETSIFTSACPHGLILWLVDMIQSGELYVR